MMRGAVFGACWAYEAALVSARRLRSARTQHRRRAIAWVLSHPAVTVCLCGAKSAEQVDDHVRAASWQLTAEDRRDIDRLLGSAGPTA